jgi:hypothetical protein
MPRYRVRHHQAVWETTTFDIEAPHEEAVREHLEELMGAAIDEDRATIEQGDAVEGIDSDSEVEKIQDPHTGEEGPCTP